MKNSCLLNIVPANAQSYAFIRLVSFWVRFTASIQDFRDFEEQKSRLIMTTIWCSMACFVSYSFIHLSSKEIDWILCLDILLLSLGHLWIAWQLLWFRLAKNDRLSYLMILASAFLLF